MIAKNSSSPHYRQGKFWVESNFTEILKNTLNQASFHAKVGKLTVSIIFGVYVVLKTPYHIRV
jgi:hypothetical protein